MLGLPYFAFWPEPPRVWRIALRLPDGKILSRLVTTREVQTVEPSRNSSLPCNEWRGKAGGFAVQGFWCFVQSINGSYSNIVGLSLCDTMNLLQGVGFGHHH